jgi:DHA3 family multidrug efflux protein-like MFS transporter
MKHFYQVLVNTLIANVTTSFLWFCLTFWVYLETKSVLATAIIGGAYMLLVSLTSIAFGTFVDHHKKKYVMQVATLFALVAFAVAGAIYLAIPQQELLQLKGAWFWLFIGIVLAGGVVENARNIALSTTVTLLVPEAIRDRANGMVGMVSGISFLVTSVFSGLMIGFFGMGWALASAVIMMAIAAIHLIVFVKIPETHLAHDPELTKKVDLKGSIAAIRFVPGLAGLIVFTTFNNLLGGVFMALMDPYGLSLMSVQAWGLLWGVLSTGFIVGGLVVSTRGLGKRPLYTLLVVNVLMWIVCILFPIQSSILPLAIGMFAYMCMIPFIEAVEQTIIQRVVPLKRQGRVFGFAQTIESASMPLTAFLIGPLAEFVIIPSMREGGVLHQVVGPWFGTGDVRAMAIVFIAAGTIGLIATLFAFTTRSYRVLSQHYADL